MRPILETSRLALREMTPGDLDFIADLLADPEVMRFYPQCYSREESLAWIARQTDRYASHGHGFWLAVERETGQAVGQVGLLPHDIEDVPEVGLGYIIHRPYWRRGYAFEAATGCLDHAFDVLGRARVVCLVRPENEPSQAVARKLGLRPEPQLTTLQGFVHIVFALSRSERADGPA